MSSVVEDDRFVIRGPPPFRPLVEKSLGRIIYEKLSENLSEAPALIDAATGATITYQNFFYKSCSLAEGLKRCGYGTDSIFGICSENCLEFYIPVVSAFFIGAAIAPISQYYGHDEMKHALNISKPQVIFCSEMMSDGVIELKKELSFIREIIVIDADDEIEGTESMNSFTRRLLQGKALLEQFQPVDVPNTDHLAFIMCSSGTTGLPKGVMITHRNIYIQLEQAQDPRIIPENMPSSNLGLLPFYHAYGLLTNLTCICKQIKIIVMKMFEEELFLQVIEKYRISSLLLVPPLALLLAKSPLVLKYDLSSVSRVACGGAPLTGDIEEELTRRLNVKHIDKGYGLTESTLGVIGTLNAINKVGSCGKVLPNAMCKVRDPETGKSLGPNQVGELCFKGGMIMKGYYGDEEATRKAFTADGWLLTGDLGYYDEDEIFFIVDRLKELIKYKGFQVAPAELEAILLSHPKIIDAGVVGLPDVKAGELPMAFVVKDLDADLTATEVEEFVAEKVSPQKRLRGGVIFTSSIPKNASGKVLRRELRDLLKIHTRSKL